MPLMILNNILCYGKEEKPSVHYSHYPLLLAALCLINKISPLSIHDCHKKGIVALCFVCLFKASFNVAELNIMTDNLFYK